MTFYTIYQSKDIDHHISLVYTFQWSTNGVTEIYQPNVVSIERIMKHGLELRKLTIETKILDDGQCIVNVRREILIWESDREWAWSAGGGFVRSAVFSRNSYSFISHEHFKKMKNGKHKELKRKENRNATG
jgi:hypothetical protein